MSASLIESTTTVQVTDPDGHPATAAVNDETPDGIQAVLDLATDHGMEARLTAKGYLYVQLPGKNWPDRLAPGDWLVAGAAGVAVLRPIAFHRAFRRTA